jgi:hypothetical protein
MCGVQLWKVGVHKRQTLRFVSKINLFSNDFNISIKMKNRALIILGMIAFSILAGLGAGMLSLQNSPDFGLATVKFGIVTMAVSYLAQWATGISIYMPSSFLGCMPLVGVKRKCNTITTGGIKRLYLVLCEDLANDFLSFNLALTAGEYAAAIPLKDTKKFIEVEAWYDSSKIDGEMKAGGGFTQGLEFKILGYDKDIVKFQALLYETPVNAIAQGNDNKLYYVGAKYTPLMFDAVMMVPEKGTARKEVTFKAKNDGFNHPVMPLAETATFEVEALV